MEECVVDTVEQEALCSDCGVPFEVVDAVIEVQPVDDVLMFGYEIEIGCKLMGCGAVHGIWSLEIGGFVFWSGIESGSGNSLLVVGKWNGGRSRHRHFHGRECHTPLDSAIPTVPRFTIPNAQEYADELVYGITAARNSAQTQLGIAHSL
eukprot:gene42146-biopygen7237